MADNVRPLKAIKVGERIRKKLGDLDRLGASMKRRLLQPVIIRPDNTLVAGYRRLKAAEKLGWETIPVRVVHDLDNALAMLIAERDENTERLDFSPSEMVEVGRRLEEMERPAAKERQATAGPKKGPGKKASASGNFPEALKGETRNKVGAAVGTSGKNYEKAKAVIEAAERDPGRFGDLKKQMDETGKVDPAYKELKARTKAESVRSSPHAERNGNHPPEQTPEPPANPVPDCDPYGIALDDDHREIFAALDLFKQARKQVRELGKLLDELSLHRGGLFLAQRLRHTVENGKQHYRSEQLEELAYILKICAPHAAACPYCLSDRKVRSHGDCRACLGAGFTPRAVFEREQLSPDQLTAVGELIAVQPKGDAYEGG